FHRGFYQWEYVRGLQQDRWRSPLLATPERMKKYRHRENPDRSFLENDVTYRHVANNVWIEKEEDHPTARVYQWAMEFVQQNAGLQPFYLYLDTFPPHEPWEAPASFYQKYADPSYSGETIIHCYYGAAKNWYTEQEVRNIYAHYRGLCSLVDYWFGQFWKVLEQEKILDNTLVVFLSDHGTNFPWENEEGIIGKPAYALFPAVMSLPLMVRFPDGAGAGRCFSSFVYNIDVTATIYAAAGLANKVNIEGQNLRKLIFSGNWQEREYLTSRYGEYLWYRDRKHWVVLTSQGKGKYVFDVEADPNCQRNLAADRKEVVGKAYRCCLQDAGGEIPVYSEGTFTDAIGQKVKE
ncbi:MAG TPA: sulfatase-like hydrolase/transferase, partial [bacterium]|nr:sulfatase-like hydrolase/transferase [bacterium]